MDNNNIEVKNLMRGIIRLNVKLLGLVIGLITGLFIFLITNWLVVKGGHITESGEYILGPHLQLLSQFFIGYRVSFLGSIIGFLYGFAIGSLFGSAIGLIYNKIVKIEKIDKVILLIVIFNLLFYTSVMGEDTIQDFENAGSIYFFSNFLGPPAYIEEDGRTGNFLRLVRGCNPLESNTIAFETTSFEKCRKVIADFDFRIVSLFHTGGDGFGFALLNTTEYGTTGRGPSFHSEPNLSKSLGIGFDIYKNTEHDDPDGNHISVHFNGKRIETFSLPIQKILLESGFTNHAQVIVDFDSGKISVTLTTPGETPYSPMKNFFIPGLKSYVCRAAFGALSGGATAIHDFDNIRVQFLNSSNSE